MSGSVKDAIAHARNNRERSIATLIDLVKIPSLTGEEGNAQVYMSELLSKAGADVEMEEPDVAGLFESFPDIAQYPTHWQHDLILPYADLPSHESLKESGLESVLNYDKRPNVVGAFKGDDVPRSRFALLDMMRNRPDLLQRRIATYDIAASGLGYLFAHADSLEATTFGAMLEGFARVQAVATCCSSEIIDAVAERTNLPVIDKRAANIKREITRRTQASKADVAKLMHTTHKSETLTRVLASYPEGKHHHIYDAIAVAESAKTLDPMLELGRKAEGLRKDGKVPKIY